MIKGREHRGTARGRRPGTPADRVRVDQDYDVRTRAGIRQKRAHSLARAISHVAGETWPIPCTKSTEILAVTGSWLKKFVNRHVLRTRCDAPHKPRMQPIRQERPCLGPLAPEQVRDRRQTEHQAMHW